MVNKFFYYNLVITFISRTIKDYNMSINMPTNVSNIKFLTLQDDELNEYVPVVNLTLNGKLSAKYVSINHIIEVTNKLELINTVYAVNIKSDNSLIFIFDKTETPNNSRPLIDKLYNNYFFINDTNTIIRSNYFKNCYSIDNETFMFTANVKVNDDKLNSYICLLNLE